MKNQFYIYWSENVFYKTKIEAESESEAIKLFRQKKELAECTGDAIEFDDVLINKLEIIEPELSASDLAFLDAYQHAVAAAPKSLVKIWLQSKDHDKFCDEYPEYYGSITDAYEIWLMAQSFIKENSK